MFIALASLKINMAEINTNEQLIEELKSAGYLKNKNVEDAFFAIDRKNFVPSETKGFAYINEPISIGEEQTISQPLTVAFMLELLGPKPGETIMDIGSGSGWQTAMLAHIVSEGKNLPEKKGVVVAIERIPKLYKMAFKNISKYGFVKNEIVKLVFADGLLGFEELAPYDKIIAAASGDKIPDAWKNQLKIGGRIVAPIKNSIIVLDKIGNGKFKEREYFGFSFVPMISGIKGDIT